MEGLDMYPFWVIDKPDIFCQPKDRSRFKVKGWIATLDKVEKLEFANKQVADILLLSLSSRPDVQEMYKHLTITGFEGACSFDQVCQYDTLTITVETGNRNFEIIVPVHCIQPDAAERKARKLKHIFSYLQCPHCHSAHFALLHKPLNTIVARIQRHDGKRVSLLQGFYCFFCVCAS